jgi:hypothetical protein
VYRDKELASEHRQIDNLSSLLDLLEVLSTRCGCQVGEDGNDIVAEMLQRSRLDVVDCVEPRVILVAISDDGKVQTGKIAVLYELSEVGIR